MALIYIVASCNKLESVTAFVRQLLDNESVSYIILFEENIETLNLVKSLANVTTLPIKIIVDNLLVENDVVYIHAGQQRVGISEAGRFTTSILDDKSNAITNSLAALDLSNTDVYVILLIEDISHYLTALKILKNKQAKIFYEKSSSETGHHLSNNHLEVIDYNAPIDDISECLFSVIRKLDLANKAIVKALERIFHLLEMATGYNFAGYKTNTIYRRIFRQMTLYKSNNIEGYLQLLEKDQSIILDLFKDLLISVTSFFRDPQVFIELKSHLKRALEKKQTTEAFRVWVPGCSTGEEVYSLAMLIYEASNEVSFAGRIQIFATDIDNDALKFARSGNFSSNIHLELDAHWLDNYFTKTSHGYKVKKFIRDLITFGVHNLISDPPFTKLDLISCRNVFIYFKSSVQKQILPVLHYSLLPKGLLLLGMAETIGSEFDKFTTISRTYKIYQKIPSNTFHQALSNFPVSTVNSNFNLKKFRTSPLLDVENIISQAVTSTLLSNYAPIAVVIDEASEILFNQGNLLPYVTINSGDKKTFLFDFLDSRFKQLLVNAMLNAKMSRAEVNLKDVVFISQDRKELNTNLRLFPIFLNNGAQIVFCLVFESNISPQQVNYTLFKYGSIAKLSKEIIQRDNELHSTRQNLENLLEEQKSTNEELLSANEELLSMNEEVETSKEELLSLNEELRILNTELQIQIDKFVLVSTDINNLFENIDSIAIFVDTDLKIQRFTPRMQEILFIMPGDEGRNIYHFAQHFKNEHFMEDIRHVLISHKLCTYEIYSDRDLWYQVCIMPYKKASKEVDGIVITFFDITKQKNNINKLNESYTELELQNVNLEKVFNTIDYPLLLLNLDLTIKKYNKKTLDFLLIENHSELDNRLFTDICHGAFNQDNLINFILNNLHENSAMITKVFTLSIHNIDEPKAIVFSASRLVQTNNNDLILVSMRPKDE